MRQNGCNIDAYRFHGYLSQLFHGDQGFGGMKVANADGVSHN
jgi:hypothetical protein